MPFQELIYHRPQARNRYLDIKLTQLLQNRFKELPPALAAVVRAPDLRKKVSDIGTQRKIAPDKLGKLEDETVLILLGLANPNELAEHLHEWGIEDSLAKQVAGDIETQILLAVREPLQAFLQQHIEENVQYETPKITPQRTTKVEERRSSVSGIRNILTKINAVSPSPTPAPSPAQARVADPATGVTPAAVPNLPTPPKPPMPPAPNTALPPKPPTPAAPEAPSGVK